jgi:predicted flap endonuclease-1-like 5' DNA nuclease
VEPLQIALIAVSVVLFLTLMLWWRTGRKRRRVRREAAELQRRLDQSTTQIAALRRGEREASWTAATATDRLQRSLLDLDKAEHEAKRLAADVDSLQDQVSQVDGELLRLKEDHAATVGHLGALESDLEAALQRAADSERRAEAVAGLQSRLEAVTKERDRLSATAHREEQLEGELSALGRVRQELDTARSEAAELRARLGAGDAATIPQALLDEHDDLKRRLDAVTEARLAEQAEAQERQAELERLRAAARADAVAVELEDRVAKVESDPDATFGDRDRDIRQHVSEAVEAATTRLQREVDHLRLVVAEKERIIRLRLGGAHSAPEPTPARPAVITDIKGIGPKIAAILADHGLTSVADIAALDDVAIDGLADDMPVYPGRIRDDDWVGQARRLLG